MKAHHVVGARALSQDDSSYSFHMMIGEAGEGVGGGLGSREGPKEQAFQIGSE